MAEKQQQPLYEVMIVKKYYHYVYVHAESADEAEDFVINNALNDPAFDLDSYYDDEECYIRAYPERIKRDFEAFKTLN